MSIENSMLGFLIGLMAGTIFFIDGWGPSEKGTSFVKSRRFRGLAILISGGILSPVLDHLTNPEDKYPFFIGYLTGSVIGWFSVFMFGLIIYLFWKLTKDLKKEKSWYKAGEFSYSMLDFIYLGISENPHLNAKREHDINIYKAKTDNELKKLQDELNKQDIKPDEVDEKTKKKIEEYEIRLKNVKTEADYTFEDWYYKGLAEYDKKEQEKVIAYMKNAIETNPGPNESSDAYLYMGLSYEQIGLRQKALEQYDTIINKYPSYNYLHVIYHNKSVLQTQLENYTDAWESNNMSLKSNPDYFHAKSNRALLLHKLDRNEEALAAYKEILKSDSFDSNDWYNLGIVYTQLGLFEDALNACEEAIKLNPKSASAWNNKGSCLSKLERNKEALSAYDKAIELNADYALAWYNKSSVHAELKNRDSTLVSLKHAIKHNKKYKEQAKKEEEFKFLWEDEEFKELVQ